MAFDPKCYDLAAHFLNDYPDIVDEEPDLPKLLAERIQREVDSFIEEQIP